MENKEEIREQPKNKIVFYYKKVIVWIKERCRYQLLKKIFRKLLPTFCFLIACALTFSLMTLTVSAAVRIKTDDRILSLEELVATGEHFDAVLVLGCKAYSDGSLSDRLADRVSVGISVLESGVCEKILMSGDSEYEDYDEVGAMKRAALEAGVEEETILLDPYGLSTYESMIRFRDVFHGKRVVIVTQEYHLYRALYIAEKLGLEAYGVSASLRPYRKQLIMDAREVLARCKDVWMSLVQPAPKWG